MQNTAKSLDLRGMKCPGPIVRLNAEIRHLTGGECLEAIANDPAFELDVKAWCRRTGHDLVTIENSAGETRAVIRRAA